MEDNERLAVLIDNAEQDVKHVAELLDKSDKERKRLSDKNAQLTINGKPQLCSRTINGRITPTRIPLVSAQLSQYSSSCFRMPSLLDRYNVRLVS